MWVFMYNLPGCLPEMEPMTFETFEDARLAMLEEMDARLDNVYSRDDGYDGDSEDIIEWQICMKRATFAGHGYDLVLSGPDGYVYSVTYDPEADEDE